MAKSTEQKVLAAARMSFFQYGYMATNMTLISETAGFSRVTTHKYLKNKDDALRQVCRQFQQQANEACAPLFTQQLNCWEAIDLIMQVWLKPTFEEVVDQKVLNDLRYHVQQVASDIFVEARQDLEDMLCEQIEKGVAEGSLTLEKIQVSPRQLSSLLLASLDGLRSHLDKTGLQTASQDVLRIYQLACQ